MKRFRWTEIRHGEMYCIIADETETGFEFAERSTWEVRWYNLDATEDLIAHVAHLAGVEGKPASYQQCQHCTPRSDVCLERETNSALAATGSRTVSGRRFTGRRAKPTASKYPWASGCFYLFALT